MTVCQTPTVKQAHVANHYVPKLYLKQWAASGMIPTYRLLVPNESCPLWKRHSLRGIAYHQHLYTYIAGGEATDEFERWLDSEFEGPAEKAIDRVVREDTLTPEHWMRLARFAVAQDVRTPARLREFLARQSVQMPDLLQRVVHDSVRRLEHGESPAGLQAAAAEEESKAFPLKVTIEREPDGGGTLNAATLVGRKMWIWSLRHFLTSTIEKLPKTRWTILHAPSNLSWPTTDNPLIRLNFFGPTNYNFGGGWGVQNGDILLPLSPSTCFTPALGESHRNEEPYWTQTKRCSSGESSSSTGMAMCSPGNRGTSIRFAHALFPPRLGGLSAKHGSVGMMTKATPKSNCLSSINPPFLPHHPAAEVAYGRLGHEGDPRKFFTECR